MTNASAPALAGTPDHPEARDLSPYLVHMTTSEESLRSILAQGEIEARHPFGIAPYWAQHDEIRRRHLSACFTEMPLAELRRMADGQTRRRYGLVFHKKLIRRQYGQPVWYMSDGSPACRALRSLCDEAYVAERWDSPLWRITPFIDKVQSPEYGSYDFQFEREWRVVDGFGFTSSQVAMIVNVSGEPLRSSELLAWYGGISFDPTSGPAGYRWVGPAANPNSASLELMEQLFLEEHSAVSEFVEVIDDDGANEPAFLTTEQALLEMFGDIPAEALSPLVANLDGEGELWSSRGDQIDTEYYPEDHLD